MTTLMLIDLQRGMCDERGSVGSSGLASVVAETNVLAAASRALRTFRDGGCQVIHARLAFAAGHRNLTNATPRFAAHREAGRFLDGSFDTEICEEVAPVEGEMIIGKGSVSPFASSALLTQLTNAGERHLVLAGVATHLAVESAAREAADRGFAVTVLADACAAPEPAHRHALTVTIPGFATVTTTAELNV